MLPQLEALLLQVSSKVKSFDIIDNDPLDESAGKGPLTAFLLRLVASLRQALLNLGERDTCFAGCGLVDHFPK